MNYACAKCGAGLQHFKYTVKLTGSRVYNIKNSFLYSDSTPEVDYDGFTSEFIDEEEVDTPLMCGKCYSMYSDFQDLEVDDEYV